MYREIVCFANKLIVWSMFRKGHTYRLNLFEVKNVLESPLMKLSFKNKVTSE